MSQNNNSSLFYILLRNHNRVNLTKNAIKSLLKQRYKNYKILIIDDGSKDNSIDSLKLLSNRILILRTKKYLEYCKSFNLGIKKAIKAKAKYIFIVNNDTAKFSLNYLEKANKILNQNKKIGLLGSTCYDFNKRVLWKKGELKEKFGIFRDTPDCGFIVRTKVFQKLGLFNERLVRYFEDLDLIMRLRKGGYITASEPSIYFYHLGEGTSGKQSFVPNYFRIRNIILFMKKYKKNESILWKIRTFCKYSKIHIERLKVYYSARAYFKFVKIIFSILLGFICGLLISWKENE